MNPLDSMKKQYKSGTQLIKTSAEELQGLSQRAGLPVQPTSPIEAGVIGGTPSQAKMAGSSANIQAAQQIALGAQELPTYLRQLQRQAQVGEQERQKIERAKQMGQLTSFDTRVQELIESTLAVTPTQLTALQINEDKVNQDVPVESRELVKSFLNKVANNTATLADYQGAGALLGFTDGTNLNQFANSLKTNYLKTPEQTLQGAYATALPDNLQMSQLTPEGLGFNNWSEVAATLKVPEQELTSMTIGQVMNKINQIKAEEFSRVDALQRIIRDPSLGAAEKNAAREQLRALGFSGERAIETDVSRLVDSVNRADSVEIGGKEFSIGDLLSDTHLSGMIKDYIENPEMQEEIKQKYPGLADFIDKNREALSGFAAGIDSKVSEMAQVVEQNKSLGTSVGLNEGAMKALFGDGWDKKYTPLDKPNLFNTFENPTINKDIKDRLADLVNYLATDNPDTARELAGLSTSQLSQKGLLTPEGISTYREYTQTRNILSELDPDSDVITPEGVFGALGLDADGIEDVKGQLEEIARMNATGLLDKADPALLSLVDSDKDGVIDNYTDILQKLQEKFKGKPLSQLVNAKELDTPSKLISNLRELISKSRNKNTPEAQLYRTHADLFKDGVIGATDIEEMSNDITSSALGESLLEKMRGLDAGGKEKLKDLVNSKANQEFKTLSSQIVANYGIDLEQPITTRDWARLSNISADLQAQIDKTKSKTLKEILTKKKEEADKIVQTELGKLNISPTLQQDIEADLRNIRMGFL